MHCRLVLQGQIRPALGQKCCLPCLGCQCLQLLPADKGSTVPTTDTLTGKGKIKSSFFEMKTRTHKWIYWLSREWIPGFAPAGRPPARL